MIILIIVSTFHFVINESIDLKNFGKYHCKNGTTYFNYNFQPNVLPKYEGIAYFFFGIFNSNYIKLLVYDENKGEFITIFIMNSDEKFHPYKIKNITSQKYIFQIISTGADLIFIDNSKEIEIDYFDFLNFNLETATYYEGFSFPLIFNINNIPNKSIAKFNYSTLREIYNSDYLLEYCKIINNECEFKGINNTVIFEKGGKYKIKYNCNIRYNKNFEFNPFSVINTYEIDFLEFIHNRLSSNHKEQFFLLKADIYETFYIYIGDGINEIHTKFIKDSDSEDIEKIQFPYNYEKISTFYENVFDFNYKENNYLVIKVEYNVNKENKGILVGFSKFYDLKPDTIIELDKGEKVIINYSYNIDSCILVSSYENLKELNSLFDINNFTDIIKTSSSSKGNNYVYIDSSNNKSKIQFFKTDFPDYSKTKLNLYVNNDIQNYFDDYGSDLLFMRMSSHSVPLTFHIFYIYGFKEKYSLYIKKLYGNTNFYQYLLIIIF